MPAHRISKLEYAIRDVIAPADKLEEKGISVLKLNVGDPDAYDFDAPTTAKNAFIKAIQQGKNQYGSSTGEKAAREAVAEREKRTNHVETNPRRVLITNGVSEAIIFLCGALMEKEKEFLVPSPTYPLYLSFPRFFGGRAISYACDEDQDWNPNLEDIKEKISPRTQALTVINPNNPTGAVYSKQTLNGLVDLAIDHNITLVSDEIYDQLTFTPYTCLSKLAQEKGARIVQMNGLSKNFFATGWRIGYAVFHNCDELFNACTTQARNRLSATTPAEYALAGCLNASQEFREENKKKIERRSQLTYRKCKEAGLSCVKPQGAFYAFPKIGEGVDDKKWVLDLLQEKHVLTVFGSGFGYKGKGHFRVVTLPPEDIITEAFHRIQDFIKHRSA